MLYLAHLDVIVDCRNVQRAPSVVVGSPDGVLPLCQEPPHEVLSPGLDGLVKGEVAARVAQPEALGVARVEDLERAHLTFGGTAVRRTGMN
jgi:hypothetical protein